MGVGSGRKRPFALYEPIHPLIHSSTHPPIHSSTHPPIHPSTHPLPSGSAKLTMRFNAIVS
ncbi:hypothetical protein [Chamaesiphon polymorphus]|uniref:hypothetical protein n=1 Tax=Chamaesiphon polymorphus TaxID=2107691 RepID=UPI0015E66C66|nr:hypothetical protein [Chamaesiphon polymorphus]